MRQIIIQIMKSLYFTFILIFSLTAFSALHTVWFVPDWQLDLSAQKRKQSELTTILKQTFPEADIIIQNWPHIVKPEQALAEAELFVARLGENIMDMTPEQLSKLTIIGHSRGANIVYRVMEAFHSLDSPDDISLKPRQCIFLESLIPLTEKNLSDILQDTILPSICICDPDNYFRHLWHDLNPGQKLLGDDTNDLLPETFIIAPFHTTLAPNIKQILDIDNDIYSQSILNYQYAIIYLRCLQIELWGNLPPYDLSALKKGYNKHIFCDFKQPSTHSFNWWEPIDRHPDWILLQHVVTGHCKIINAKGEQRFDKKQRPLWGECREICKKFDELTDDIIDIENFKSAQRTNSHRYWDVVKSHEGWELQKNNVFGNSRVINSTDNRCIKSGFAESVNKAFEIVCQQVDAVKARPPIDVLKSDGPTAIRDAVWWRTIQDNDCQPYAGWRLEKHIRSGYCRIMDNANRCRYSADESNAKRMFEEICNNLKSNDFKASLPHWTPPAVIWYVPGWKRCEPKLAPEHEDYFKKAFPGSKAEIANWEGNGNWSDSVAKADEFAKSLVEKIAAMKPEEREQLTLIGHSLGGRIVTRTVAELLRRNLRIQNACLLAAAIPFDDPDAELALKSQSMPVISIYNPNDRMLFAYRIGGGEHSKALGAHSTGRLNEFPVSWNTIEDTHIPTTDINWDFVKSAFNHTAIFYLRQLKKIIDSLQ